MKSCRLTICTLLLTALIMPLHVGLNRLWAESTIRIIGDKPPQAAHKGSATIRIVGDRQEPVNNVPSPSTPADSTDKNAQKQAEEAEKEYEATLKAVRDKADAEAARQASIINEQKLLEARKAEEERLALEKAEKERQAKLKAEQEKAEQERLDRLKAEQERLDRLKQEQEKAEQERLAKLKAEQERAAAELARQTALLMEQKLLAERKAEELRKAADQAEKERIEALKADEERLEAARKALLVTETIGREQNREKTTGTSVAGNDTSSADREKSIGSGTDISIMQKPFSIWELYQLAKKNDPALGRTEARVSGSKADSDILFSSLLPHLDSGAGIRQISQSLSHYNSTSNTTYDYNSLNYNLTARLTLLNVPALYSLSAYSAALRVEQAGLAAARQNLIVKLTDAYFNLLKAQTDRQIAVGEINRLRQVLDQSQAFLKAGTGDIIAVYEAQSRLDGAKADLAKSESNLRLAEQKLSNLVGKPVMTVVNYLPQQPAGPEPADLDWWIKTMESEQPLVRQARESVAQTSEQRKAAKAEYLPVLQASGGYDVNRGTPDQPSAEVRQWFVGASISLPLYSGGETSAKVRRAIASEEERQHIFTETMDQQRENIKQAYFNLQYNISLIKALDQKKTSAEIQLAAVKKGRKIGTRNAIDVLNAEQTYSMALRDHRYALYENITRIIQLKSTAGILTEMDISAFSQLEAPSPDNGFDMIISRMSVK